MLGKRDKDRVYTNLRPNHLSHSTDELRRCCSVVEGTFFVDEFAEGEPEGGFEALVRLRLAINRFAKGSSYLAQVVVDLFSHGEVVVVKFGLQ